MILFRAHFIDIPFDGQTHPARNRLGRLEVQYHGIEKPFRNVERLCHLFSRFHFLSRHKSKGRNMVLRPLSGFINQLEAGLLVHALHLPLHLQRLGVSSSPMETMFASAPSKLPQSASRTSHPTRLSPQVKTLLRCGLYHRAPFVHNLDRSLPCGRKQYAIVQIHLWISFHNGPGMRYRRFPHISHRSLHVTVCLSSG